MLHTMTNTGDNGEARAVRRWTIENAPELPTTAEWRQQAIDAYKVQLGPQAALAKAVGGSQSGISLTLSGQINFSKYVLPICEVLDIPPPVAVLDDPRIGEFYELLLRLRKEHPEWLDAQLASLRALLSQK